MWRLLTFLIAGFGLLTELGLLEPDLSTRGLAEVVISVPATEAGWQGLPADAGNAPANTAPRDASRDLSSALTAPAGRAWVRATRPAPAAFRFPVLDQPRLPFPPGSRPLLI